MKKAHTLQQRLHPFIWMLMLSLAACSFLETTSFVPRRGDAPLPQNIAEYGKVDSVMANLDLLSSSQVQIDSLLYFTDRVLNYDEKAAFQYATAANDLASKENKDLEKGISFYYLSLIIGRTEIDSGGIERPFFYARMSKRLFEEEENALWQIFALTQIGDLFRRQISADSAESYFRKALQLVEQGNLGYLDSLSQKGGLLHEIGNVHLGRKNYDSASYYFDLAEVDYLLGNENSAFLRLSSSRSILYLKQGEYEKANNILLNSIAYADSVKDFAGLALLYSDISLLRVYQFIGEAADPASKKIDPLFREAVGFAKKGIALNPKKLYYFYNLVGVAFDYRRGYLTDEKEQIRYSDSALVNYRLAMRLASEDGVIETSRQLVSNITDLCDFRKENWGLDCQDGLQSDPSTFLNNAYGGIINNLRKDFQSLNQQIVSVESQEIIKQESRSRLYQQLIGGVIFLFSGLIFLILYQQLQKKRLNAKMEALRAQINPHFISNSLNAIENLVNQDKKEAAAKYLIHFSRFSRKILNSSRQANTSLASELETIEHFLALEKLRFRDKLEYTIQCADELNTANIEVPAMILQPYVENAILHGIKPKRSIGMLQIRVEQAAKELHISIEDNGIGRKKSQALQASSVLGQKRKSQGMQITKERLQSMGSVKGKHVEIKDLHLENGEAAGTLVQLRLPLKQRK